MPKIYLHVVNKYTISGGIENLVYRIIDHKSNYDLDVKHIVFQIAPNRISQALFAKSKFRIIILLFSYFRLLYRIFSLRIVSRNDLKIIYHTAESHLLLYFAHKTVFCLTKPFNFIYFHQSAYLYPKKILPYAIRLCRISKINFILYSKQLLKGWFFDADITPHILHAAPRELIKQVEIDKYNFPFFIFVGRDVDWKGLDIAISLTEKCSNLISDLHLLVVGGDRDSMRHKWQNDSFFKNINFAGSIKKPAYSGALLTLAPFDFSKSLESIGIASLESISNGIPVIVQDGATSDYLGFPGIYTISEISLLFKESTSRSEILSKLNGLKLSSSDLNVWRKELSFDRYMDDLHSILELINGESLF